MNVQIIKKKGKPEWVVIPYDEYNRLIEEIEQLRDIQAYDEVKSYLKLGEEELIPHEVAKSLILGENPIKVWREYRGLTRKELAKRAGITATYLARLERGERKGTLKVLSALAKALDVSIEDLLPGD